ncbi:MAG: hypothetical protein ACM32O_13615 [Clostridia bacterium]
MDTAMLSNYLERPVIVHMAPHMISTPDDEIEEGQLIDFDSSGIVLKQTDGMLLYIPSGSYRFIRIKPAPSFWQRLTGTS